MEQASVTVTAASRVHFGLIDLGRATRRAYGGAGLLLKWPNTVIRSDPGSLSLNANCEVDERSLAHAWNAVERLRAAYPGIEGDLRVIAAPPSHVGFGSKTSLILAVLTALIEFNGLSFGQHDLIRVCGRGGASGVGVNGFFSGGWVFDGGHCQAAVAELQPSSVRSATEPAPLLVSPPSAQDWHVHLMLPPGSRMSGELEEKFFAENTPTSELESLRALAATYHGLLPAIVLCDYSLLRQSLRDIGAAGFKRSELALQPGSCDLLNEVRRSTDMACGMSSLGPLVFAIEAGKSEAAKAALQAVCHERNAIYLGCSDIAHRGHWISK
jgi:beta-ribofuranosylaminobenzene 5'-phosphate synthase